MTNSTGIEPGAAGGRGGWDRVLVWSRAAWVVVLAYVLQHDQQVGTIWMST